MASYVPMVQSSCMLRSEQGIPVEVNWSTWKITSDRRQHAVIQQRQKGCTSGLPSFYRPAACKLSL